jgi:RNA polymerase sigma-70 factor, ECF subfamily
MSASAALDAPRVGPLGHPGSWFVRHHPPLRRSATASATIGRAVHEPLPDTPAPSDAALVGRLVDGDGDALREAYAAHGTMVYSVAVRILDDPGLAEECTQDVFVSLWRKAATFDPDRARLSTWLFTLARNRAITLGRSRAARPATPFADVPEVVDESDPADAAIASDQSQAIAEALAELPEEQREVVVLAYVNGLTQDQISERLHLPLGTVKGRARLALDRLRTTLDPEVAKGGTR